MLVVTKFREPTDIYVKEGVDVFNVDSIVMVYIYIIFMLKIMI